MKKIKNLAKTAWNLLPINIEKAVYKNEKQGLLKILEGDSYEKEQRIIDYHRRTAGLMSLTTFVDGITCFWIYGGLMNIFTREQYTIGATAVLGSLFIRAYMLHMSKE